MVVRLVCFLPRGEVPTLSHEYVRDRCITLIVTFVCHVFHALPWVGRLLKAPFRAVASCNGGTWQQQRPPTCDTIGHTTGHNRSVFRGTLACSLLKSFHYPNHE